MQEGALRGVRRALPGAAAVASVDALCCVLALLVGGAAAPHISQWRPWPAVVGGVALLVVAGVGLHRDRARRSGKAAPDEVAPDGAAPDGAAPDGASAGGTPCAGATPTGPVSSPYAGVAAGWRRYALFFGLTAVNPLTLVYFAALVPGLAALTSRAALAAAFVVGVGVTSFGWQALLVVVGSVLGGRAGPRVRRATVVVGNAIVAVLGLLTLAHAAW